MKQFIVYLALFLSFFVFVFPVLAAKKRIRNTNTASVNVGLSYSSAKLNRPSNSIIVSFKNLNGVSKVNYELSYTANGVSQGAMGSLVPSGNADSRDLYFGTCSKGVCTPHRNIRNAVLVVRCTLKNSAVNTKRYKIKV